MFARAKSCGRDDQRRLKAFSACARSIFAIVVNALVKGGRDERVSGARLQRPCRPKMRKEKTTTRKSI